LVGTACDTGRLILTTGAHPQSTPISQIELPVCLIGLIYYNLRMNTATWSLIRARKFVY